MGNIVSGTVGPTITPSAGATATTSPPVSGVAPLPPEPGPTHLPLTDPAAAPQDQPASSTTPSTFSIEAPPTANAHNSYMVDPFATVSADPTPPSVPPTAPTAAPTAATAAAATITPPPTTTAAPATTASPSPSSPPVSAAELLARMPSVTEMMQELEKSGCLLPDLAMQSMPPVDTSPLAALQPGHQQPFFSSPATGTTPAPLSEVKLTNTGKPKPTRPAVEMPVYIFIAVITLLQSLLAIVIITHYFFVKYRELELMITAGIMSTEEVNSVTVKVAIVGVVGLISFISALRLLIKKSENHSVATYVAVCLIILNFIAQNVIGRNQFAAGNPLLLPETIAQILTALQQPRF